jgi:hypothetical protein
LRSAFTRRIASSRLFLLRGAGLGRR